MAVTSLDPFDDKDADGAVELLVDELLELGPVRLDELGDSLLEVNGHIWL